MYKCSIICQTDILSVCTSEKTEPEKEVQLTFACDTTTKVKRDLDHTIDFWAVTFLIKTRVDNKEWVNVVERYSMVPTVFFSTTTVMKNMVRLIGTIEYSEWPSLATITQPFYSINLHMRFHEIFT